MKFLRPIILSLVAVILIFVGIKIILPHINKAKASSPVTWYIRPDGGTRFDSNNPNGQCDGQADAQYPGSGVNQHCAFNDFRDLYEDGSYTYGNSFPGWGWVISGGDTVIIKGTGTSGGAYRIGYNGPSSYCDATGCWGIAGTPFAEPPPVPSGTPTQPTQILGANYANCTKSNMSQLHGGYGAGTVISLRGSQNVTIECVELTDYSQCIKYGNAVPPTTTCHTDYPLDDYAGNGIITDASTSNILLQDMYIHGLASRGIIGAIGGTINVNRVDIARNDGAGWDFDDGNGDPSVNGLVNANYLTIEWNGCGEEYPIVDGNPVTSCGDQDNGGYGDGIGTPATQLDFTCNHCIFRYNTQDGFDLLHVYGSTIVVTNSDSYGNMGQQYKLGAMQNVTFYNNLDVADCNRMSAPIAGAPSNYNEYLTLFCRAFDNFAISLKPGGNLDFENNTVIGGADTTFDMECGSSDCSTSTIKFKNNAILTFQDPNFNGGAAPGNFYWGPGTGPGEFTDRSNNLFYGLRNSECPSGYNNEICVDPKFVNEISTITNESDFDTFTSPANNAPAAGSPLIGAGVANSAITTDYNGVTRNNPPSIGAIEAAGETTSTDTTPPTVSITDPANNATVSATTTVTASASDNVGVTSVALYIDGVLSTTDNSAPYSFSVNTKALSNATHAFVAKAYDAAGNVGTSAQITVTVSNTVPDTTPPTVPTGLTLSNITSSSITLSWSASTDNVGVVGYNIYRNSVKIATTTSSSYANTGLSASTTYVYSVSAYDAAGNTSAQTSGVSGNTLSAPDTTPPTVPTGLTLSNITSSSITLSWSASTDNVGVTGYNVYRNGVRIATPNSTAYTSGGLSALTAYTYTISAYDAAGNTSSQTSGVLGTTLSGLAGDTIPPTASITSPQSDTTVSGSLPVTAAAADNIGVTSVALYVDGVLKATTNNAPYNFYLDTTSLSNGLHTLVAKAYDAAGNIGTSGSVSVTVLNAVTPPVIVVGGGGGGGGGAPVPTSLITAVSVGTVMPTTVNITVSTLSPANIVVKYGRTTGYGLITSASPLLTTTYVKLTDLTPNTVYDFIVTATQSGGASVNSQNYVFTTASSPATTGTTITTTPTGGNGGGATVTTTTTTTGVSIPPVTTVTGTSSGSVIIPYFADNISYGDTGSEVLLLQRMLKVLGFFPSTSVPSTYFGVITEHALLLFQSAHQLNKSGFVDAQSQILLNKILVTLPGLYSASTVSIPVTTTTDGTFTRNLSIGSSGADVAALQHVLASDGDYTSSIFSTYYGPLTQAAVQAFQVKYGIVSSGTPYTTGYGAVGTRTRAKLNTL